MEKQFIKGYSLNTHKGEGGTAVWRSMRLHQGKPSICTALLGEKIHTERDLVKKKHLEKFLCPQIIYRRSLMISLIVKGEEEGLDVVY